MTNTASFLDPVTLWSSLQTCLDPEGNSKENTRTVLSAALGTRMERFGYPSTIVALRVYTPLDLSKVSEVVLSSDGIGVESFWCVCLTLCEDDWMYYERWTSSGTVFSGWCCPDCRGVAQVGC